MAELANTVDALAMYIAEYHDRSRRARSLGEPGLGSPSPPEEYGIVSHHASTPPLFSISSTTHPLTTSKPVCPAAVQARAEGFRIGLDTSPIVRYYDGPGDCDAREPFNWGRGTYVGT